MSSCVICSHPLIIFVAHPWTCSRMSTFLFLTGKPRCRWSRYDSPGLGRGERSPPSTSCHCFSECRPQGLYKFPLYKITLLPQGQTGIQQNSQVLFCKGVFHPEIPQPLLGHGVITSQQQDFVLPFAELRVIPSSPFLQSVKVSLDPCTTLWCISCFLKFCVTCRLAEGTLCPDVEVINEDVKECRTWHCPWGSPLLADPLCATACNPFSLAAQPLFSSSHCLLLQPMLYQLFFI